MSRPATLSPQTGSADDKVNAIAALRSALPFAAPAGAITGFFGPYRWLSNFAPSPIDADGLTYPTAEHAYQAAKTLDPDERLGIARARTPAIAKRLGRTCALRPNWDAISTAVMLEILAAKFADPDLGAQLLQTYGRELIEYNTWGDVHWGAVAQGSKLRGGNRLGLCLMFIRERHYFDRFAQPN